MLHQHLIWYAFAVPYFLHKLRSCRYMISLFQCWVYADKDGQKMPFPAIWNFWKALRPVLVPGWNSWTRSLKLSPCNHYTLPVTTYQWSNLSLKYTMSDQFCPFIQILTMLQIPQSFLGFSSNHNGSYPRGKSIGPVRYTSNRQKMQCVDPYEGRCIIILTEGLCIFWQAATKYVRGSAICDIFIFPGQEGLYNLQM